MNMKVYSTARISFVYRSKTLALSGIVCFPEWKEPTKQLNGIAVTRLFTVDNYRKVV